MFRRLFVLELRKQKKASLSVLLVMILGVLGTTFFVAQGKWSVAEAYLGAMTFCLYGLPLIGVVLGASSAMGIRNQNVRDSEEVLPSAPAGRVFGAYLAGAVYFLGIALIVFALYPSRTAELTWIGFLELPYLHFLAFAITYALKLPVLGAGLAVILIGIDTLFTDAFVRVFRTYPDLSLILLRPAFSIPIWTVGVLALWMLSRQIEHNKRPGVLRAVIAAMSFLSAPVLSALLWVLIARVLPAGIDSIWDLFR